MNNSIRPVVPEDIRKQMLRSHMLDKYDSLPPSHQREYLTWIESAKKSETRQQRVAKMLEAIKQRASTKLS